MGIVKFNADNRYRSWVIEAIPGTPPDLLEPPKVMLFASRNVYALAIDSKEEPPFFKV